MSRLGYISNSVGKQLNLAVANTYSTNVLGGSNLPANSIIISSPVDSRGNDIGTYSMIATDNDGNPIRLTYSVSEGNGLYYSSFSDSLKLNIDNTTIKTNSTYNLYSTLKNVIDEKTLISNSDETISVDVNSIGLASADSVGVAKLDGQTISSDNGKIFVNTSKLEYSNSLSETFGIAVGDGVGLISTNGLLEINESSLERGTREKVGVVRADGETISSNNGILSANTISFAKALKDRFGISKLDNIKLKFNKDNKVSVNTNSIQSTSDKNFGISKIDTNTLDIDNDNILSAKKYMSIKDYINKYYDLSEEYRNKLSAIREEIAQNPKFLKKDEILLFSINETSVTSLDKPKYQESVINMPNQYVNVDLNIITTCDFTLSVLFDDETNEPPSVTLINVNYNDENIFEDNKIDPNKVYSSTNGELKKITLKFWAKNFSNSKKQDTISTGILITCANANNTEKSITEKYAIIRYNSLYEKYEEDKEIIVDEGRWQLISSSLEWKEIRSSWDGIDIPEENRWQSANVVIPNRYRRVEIRYQIQNLDTGDVVSETAILEIIRGNALKSSVGKLNGMYKLYNYETHKPYEASDFDKENESDLTDKEREKMYPQYNDVADIITYATDEGQFISIQVRFKQQVFPAEMIYNTDPREYPEFNIYTYLVQNLDFMFRVDESSSGVSTYRSMINCGSWDTNPDPAVLYWVYLDDVELTDSSKIFYNTDNNDQINSSFDNANTNHLKLYSSWGSDDSHVLRFIPVNEITSAYHDEENFSSYFEDIIDLFSVVIKNVKPHREKFNIEMRGNYDEFTYGKKLDAIPARFQYNYTTYWDDKQAPSINFESNFVIYGEFDKNISSVPDISTPTMSYAIPSGSSIVFSDGSMRKENEGDQVNVWYCYLNDLTYLTKEYYDDHGDTSNNSGDINMWNIPINQRIDYDPNDILKFRNTPAPGSSDFTNTAIEHLRIVSSPAITIAGLNYDKESKKGINVFITYPTDALMTLENTYKLVKEDNVTELTVSNLLLITVAQENLLKDIAPGIEVTNSGSDMFNGTISHAPFNTFSNNTVTYYQINSGTTTYFKASDNSSISHIFNPGDKVNTWSVNTYIGKTYDEYSYLFDKYYDSLPEDKLTYLLENNSEIYFFNSGNEVTYLYDYTASNISGVTYFSFYKGHNHYQTNYTSYALSSTISSTIRSNSSKIFDYVSYTSNNNVAKNLIKYVINNSSTLSINEYNANYTTYIQFANTVTIDNNTTPFIFAYAGDLIDSNNITNLNDYNDKPIYFNEINFVINLYADRIFSLPYEQTLRDELSNNIRSITIDDTTRPIPDTDPQQYEQIPKYSEPQITEQVNNIISGIKNDLDTLLNQYKQKLISVINQDISQHYVIYSNSVETIIDEKLYFSIPSDLDTDGYTIKHYNGFDLFIWNLFNVFNPDFYSIQFYEYGSNGQIPVKRGYHGVEIIRSGFKYNIGIFVLSQNFSNSPDFFLFTEEREFDVYSLNYYTNHKIEYTMSSNSNETIPISFSLTLYNSSLYDQIFDLQNNMYNINYTYQVTNGGSLSSYPPRIDSGNAIFTIPYNDNVTKVFSVQRSLTISQNETVYGPVHYIYLPPKQDMSTNTFYDLIPRDDNGWKLFDIPDNAPGMWNITNAELFVLKSEYTTDDNKRISQSNINNSFKGTTAMFSYVGSIEKGERYDDYDVDYWEDDDTESRTKSVFGLCNVHNGFWNVIPNYSAGGDQYSKPYKIITPTVYRESEENQNNG